MLRDELLNGELFSTLREAQILIENWRAPVQHPATAQVLRTMTAGAGDDRRAGVLSLRLPAAGSSPGAGDGTNTEGGPMNGVRSPILTAGRSGGRAS